MSDDFFSRNAETDRRGQIYRGIFKALLLLCSVFLLIKIGPVAHEYRSGITLLKKFDPMSGAIIGFFLSLLYTLNDRRFAVAGLVAVFFLFFTFLAWVARF